MLGALEAILGQRSAHSLATGPVTVEPRQEEDPHEQKGHMHVPFNLPFISPLLFTITPALSIG